MLRYRVIFCFLALALTGFSVSAFAQQPTGPQQCVAFNTLAEQHESRAESILKSIESDTRGKSANEVARIMQERATAAGSEEQLASLSREAYRKCLTDYVGGGASPVQQATPQQPVQQAPAEQAPVQQAPAQQAPAQVQQRPVQQQQQQQRVYRQQQPQQQQQQQPGIIISPGGLIDLGIGIGLGRQRDR